MGSVQSAILIPAYCPGEELCGYVRSLLAAGFTDVLVVDDGSGPDYAAVFEEIKTIAHCTLLVHEVNRGKGAALKTGIQYYLDRGMDTAYNGLITVDADGQHTLEDTQRIADEMRKEADSLILGERKFDQDVPLRSRFGNGCTRFFFRLLYGLNIYDTQTGLRGFPNALLPRFLTIEGDRYEYEMNMLVVCSREKIPVRSIWIRTVYINNNEASHFDTLHDSIKVYRVLFGNFFTFIVSSLSSSLIDIGVFHLFVSLLRGKAAAYILIATVIARAVSSFYNFNVNRKLVFHSETKIRSTIGKYYILVVCQMLLSAALVTGLHKLLPIAETGIKIPVDIFLFFLSYRIQQSLIFRSPGEDTGERGDGHV